MPTLATNKKASFEYELQDKFEAGLVLSGQEVKSAKTGHISLKGSYVTLRNGELFLIGAKIPKYKFSGELKNYDPERPRKLLLNKSEINSLIGKVKAQGLTLVPIQVYTKGRLLKLKFAIGRGKKKFDKRESIKKQASKRKAQRALKSQ